ncbi:MAG TPA: glycosyltransferase family 39 protein [bacterium]|nr:glycosyltransferase family 39 protein [bacterium]
MEKNKKLTLITILALTLFRLIYINLVPLVPQEAYYWKYAKHLALSYFDHPPMAAWTIAFFTALGGDSVFFIRLGSVLYSLGMMVLLYRIVIELFDDERMGLWTVITINCTVLFSIGATVITPDVPMLFFWTLIVYFMVKLLKTSAAKWWYFAGMAMGFGMLSKYTAVLLGVGIFLFLLFSKEQRHWLKTVHPYLSVLIALLIFTPVLIWNYQHDWASFAFQSSRRFSEMKRLRLDYLGQLIGSQLGMLTPYLFLIVIGGWLFAGWKTFKEKKEKFALLFWFSLPVFFIFTFSSFRSLVKMNWMAPAYITSIIAAMGWIFSAETRRARWFARYLKAGLILGLLIVIFMHILPLFPVMPIKKGDTWTGWEELAERVMIIKKEMGEDSFIFSHEYKIPSQISFYTPHHEPTHAGEVIGENGLQYNFWTDIPGLIGKDAIFITSDAQRYRRLGNLSAHFETVAEDPPLVISHRGKVFRIFYIYRCYQYQGTLNRRDS